MFKSFLVTSLFSAVAFAQPAVPKYSIKQVIAPEHQVVVEASYNSDLKPGKIFLATFEDGSQCALSLKSVNKKNLVFDSTTCKKEDQLTLRTPVEPALTDSSAAAVPAEAPAPTEEKQPLDNPVTRFNKSLYDGRFGLTLSYAYNKDLSYSDGEIKQTGATRDIDDGEIDFKDKNVMGIGVSYARLRPHEWGFSGSLLYEFPRELRSYATNIPGVGNTFTTLSSNPKLSVLLFEANLLYRWDLLYVPFGLNISVPFLSDKGEASARPGVGLYAGLGLLVTEDIGLELFLRSVGVDLRDKDPITGDEVKFNQANAFGAGASLKYWF